MTTDGKNLSIFLPEYLVLHQDKYGFVDGSLISIVPGYIRINHIECLPLQEYYFTCP